MAYQKFFRYAYIEELKNDVTEHGKLDGYIKGEFKYSADEVLENRNIVVPDRIKLTMPEKGDSHDFENARSIYEAYKKMTRTEASDTRIWTYLSHITFHDYMRKRCPVEAWPEEGKKKKKYILEHWFLNGLNSRTLTRQNIAMLWWGAHLTYDPQRKNPYELTEELFSMLDYTRTLLSLVQGRNNNFTRALLEYVVENKKLFERAKESKIRLLTKKLNYRGGYTLMPTLNKEEIKKILNSYRSEIKEITGRNSK
jgi:hypothetical protein